ncbi:MAG: hypothetical protein ACR2JM_13855 [Mycobacterium sp.]
MNWSQPRAAALAGAAVGLLWAAVVPIVATADPGNPGGGPQPVLPRGGPLPPLPPSPAPPPAPVVPPASFQPPPAAQPNSPSVAKLVALALPGVAGLAALTGVGGVVGYRQAKAGFALRASGAARFLP